MLETRFDWRSCGALAGALSLLAAAVAGAAGADSHEASALARTRAPEGARAYIISPADGEIVPSPLVVRFGLAGMGVAPAGVANPQTGHHHLVIDAPTPPADQPIPNDANYRHFGGGQTQAVVELPPGTHTLQLVLGDHLHMPHDPPIASQIVTITVE